MESEKPNAKPENTANPKPDMSTNLIKLPRFWFFLMTIRFLVTIFGQRAYIHPDEFFQGPEVISGLIFNSSSSIYQPWEFNSHQPIRNIVIPLIFYGLPLELLKMLSNIFSIKDYTKYSPFNPPSDFNPINIQSKTLLYYPRLFMTTTSLISDFTILKTAEMCNLDQYSVILTFASSYLTIIFLTRTFSNSIETILLSVLIYLVVKSIKSQRILNDKLFVAKSDKTLVSNPQWLDFNHAETSDKQKITINRVKLFDIFKFDYLSEFIGLVVCLGIFNRPTFILFAIVPVSFWILYGLENCNNSKQFLRFLIRRTLSLTKIFIPLSIALMLADTIFYHKLSTIDEIMGFLLSHRKLISTPLNFFIYNSNGTNLDQHGRHPFYLHFMVNSFLLFGVNYLMIILFFFNFFFIMLRSVRDEMIENDHPNNQVQETNLSILNKLKIKLNSFKIFLIQIYCRVINNTFFLISLTFFIPLILFSFIPHQEPRFLLPLVVPVSLLTGHLMFGETRLLTLKCAWILFNISAGFIYGYMHQGGVLPSLSNLQKMFAHQANLEMDQHVVYMGTYMPPRFLTHVPFNIQIVHNKRFIYEKTIKKINEDKEEGIFRDEVTWVDVRPPLREVYDLMGDLDTYQDLIKEIKLNYTKSKTKNDLAIFLVVPSVFDTVIRKSDLNDQCFGKTKSNANQLTFMLHSQYKFHLTFEHLNEQFEVFNCNFNNFKLLNKELANCVSNRCKRDDFTKRFVNAFSLNFYQAIL